jgi:hypothetical protein
VSVVKLEKRGPLLGVCLTREEAERSGASWCSPGHYGNPHGEGIAAIVDEIKREGDGRIVYGVWLGVQQS